MKNLRWTLLGALLLTANGIAQAQAPVADPRGSSMSAPAPSMPSSPSMAGSTGTTGGNSTAGTINSASDSSSTAGQGFRTNTSDPGLGPDQTAVSDTTTTTTITDITEEGALPNTGGEPIIMSLVGLSIAMAAFLVRRRVSA